MKEKKIKNRTAQHPTKQGLEFIFKQKGGSNMKQATAKNRSKELAKLEHQAIAFPNSELPDPYCYQEWDSERNTWVGVLDDYDPERIIPGWVAVYNDGFVYPYDPETGKINLDGFIDENFDWDYAVELMDDIPEAFFIYEEE